MKIIRELFEIAEQAKKRTIRKYHEAFKKLFDTSTESEECQHDYFCCSQSPELRRYIEETGETEHFKIATLVCRKCGETKQIEVDKHIQQRH